MMVDAFCRLALGSYTEKNNSDILKTKPHLHTTAMYHSPTHGVFVAMYGCIQVFNIIVIK